MRQLGYKFWVALSKILRWGASFQAVVGTHCIVGLLPGQESRLDYWQIQVPIVALPKLFGVGTVSSLHMAVELRAMGWQDKEANPLLLASSLKAGHELATAIHLDSPQRGRGAAP